MDKIIPKFRGIKAYEEELSAKTFAEQPMNLEVKDETRSLKRKSVEIDPKLKEQSNEKRLKSLKDKIDYDKRQQTLVKEAIISGKRVNKRIVFGGDQCSDDKIDSLLDEERVKSNDNNVDNSKPKKQMNLFDSDSEDDDDDDNEDNNKLKDFDIDFDKKINNRNAEKLIELNSRFAHDSRFRIDDRFLDQIEDNEEVVDECEKNMHLLEEVLGKKFKPIIKSSDKKKKNSNNNELFVSRFDPKNEKSSEYEVKSISEKSKKKVSFNQKVLDEEEKQVENEVSKEVYFEVSSSLKDSLSQKEDKFSLTQIFGTSSADDVRDKTSDDKTSNEPFFDKIDKRKTDNTRNPFKYDSSSSDDEEEEDNEEVVVETKTDSKFENKPKLNSSGFRFFFEPNDPRFKEDIFWDKESAQKARNNVKERQLMIMRGMTVRKKSAVKNQKAKKKTFLKYQNNSNYKRNFHKKPNKTDD